MAIEVDTSAITRRRVTWPDVLPAAGAEHHHEVAVANDAAGTTTLIAVMRIVPEQRARRERVGFVQHAGQIDAIDLLDEHGSDGVRYWAASGRPGTDTAFVMRRRWSTMSVIVVMPRSGRANAAADAAYPPR